MNYALDGTPLSPAARELAARAQMRQAIRDLGFALAAPSLHPSTPHSIDAAIDAALRARVILTHDVPEADPDAPPMGDVEREMDGAVRAAGLARRITTDRLEGALLTLISWRVRQCYPTAARLRVNWPDHSEGGDEQTLHLVIDGSGETLADVNIGADTNRDISQQAAEVIEDLERKIASDLTWLGQCSGGYDEFLDLIPELSS